MQSDINSEKQINIKKMEEIRHHSKFIFICYKDFFKKVIQKGNQMIDGKRLLINVPNKTKLFSSLHYLKKANLQFRSNRPNKCELTKWRRQLK